MGLFDNICIDFSMLRPKQQRSEPDVTIPELPKSMVHGAPPTGIPSELPQLDALFSNKEVKEEQPVISTPPSQLTNMPPGYFSGLMSGIGDRISHTVSSQVISSDILSEMKSFWHNRHYSSNRDAELVSRMAELHQLEVEWQKHQLSFETARDELQKLELQMDMRISELKAAFVDHHKSAHLAPGNEFRLHGGGTLSSIYQMKKAIAAMPEAVFNHHVNQERHDFACWVKDVIGLPEVAMLMESARSREELSRMLEPF